MSDFNLYAVFLVGLLGGVHCIGMCGSIVGVFSRQLSETALSGPRVYYHISYNLGRLISYSAAGALVGALGMTGMVFRDTVPVQHLLFALSSLMLVLLGLYLAGIWQVVRHIERLGSTVWQWIKPWSARLLPISTLPKAFLFGMIWGWLPCGLVYSVLVMALASGSAANGALVMLAFGLGTLPNLLLVGLFWEQSRQWLQHRWLRLAAGLLVAGLGVWGLFRVAYTFYLHGWQGSCHVPL